MILQADGVRVSGIQPSKMLRTVFIGSKNEVDEILVHWLSQRVDLVGVVWTTSTKWQRSWKGRIRFAWKRLRRNGLLKTIDETLFYLCYHTMFHSCSEAEIKKQLVQPYWAIHGPCQWQGDALPTGNINSREVQEFLAKRRPDVAFAMCTPDYFAKCIRRIPRHGVFLWHEGITPEYQGLYAPFWAAYNLDFERIGYTLLRMNDRYDDGEVFVQGRASNLDPLRQTHDFMGHKAVLDSLPEVDKLLESLANGTARPIDRSDATPKSYTYPGLSHLIRQRSRLKRYASSMCTELKSVR